MKLGLAVPMSGPIAIFGRQVAKAVEIAIGELNAAGGLLGIPVELVVGDDRCDAGWLSRSLRGTSSRIRLTS